ncbi:MAG: MBL fold metallo-hydrolase [Holosporaceae bacterium]|jgi:L-ascorbate metabolism protein UlaG (beta-lactamase superfamily)|nr:MBL fold metallo-hydrolase [Holosporaceae bacterium]
MGYWLKCLKNVGIALFILSLACTVAMTIYLQLPMFGQLPAGVRLDSIRKLPNYRNGKFHNLHETQTIISNPLAAAFLFFASRSRFASRMFGEEFATKPSYPLPTVRTDLKNLDLREDVLIWFGHSSYFIQLQKQRILVDPLFSRVSSPLWFFPKAFAGTDVYGSEDMPEIDYLIITHDHWDHLDYKSVLALKNKIKKIICPIGVGQHFEYWGFSPKQIIEMHWHEKISHDKNLTIHCLPARHFSGRGIFRNKSLWGSFLIVAGNFKVYVGGDSGYDTHYTEIGKKFGPLDLVILNSGQYDKNWKYNHMNVDEVIRASNDMQAKMLLPVHICKISLAYHAWNEPLIGLSNRAKKTKFALLTPMIGEKIHLRFPHKTKCWWQKI